MFPYIYWSLILKDTRGQIYDDDVKKDDIDATDNDDDDDGGGGGGGDAPDKPYHTTPHRITPYHTHVAFSLNSLSPSLRPYLSPYVPRPGSTFHSPVLGHVSVSVAPAPRRFLVVHHAHQAVVTGEKRVAVGVPGRPQHTVRVCIARVLGGVGHNGDVSESSPGRRLCRLSGGCSKEKAEGGGRGGG